MPPSFAPHLDVLPIPGRALVTVGENGCDIYAGEAYARLGELVDGVRSETDILGADASDGAGASEGAGAALRKALEELRRAGAVLDGTQPADGLADAAWWSSQRIDLGSSAARMRATTVGLETVGELPAEATTAALTDAGVTISDDPDLRIVLTRDYLDARLAAINERGLDDGRPWLLAQPAGARILIGPVFSPDAGPCWACLATRLRRHRGAEHGLRRLAEAPGLTAPIPAPAVQRGLGPALVATETVRFIAGARPDLTTTVLSFDGRSWEAGRHSVPWRPQCPVCGGGDPPLEHDASPIRIKRGSAADQPMALRSVAPRATLQRFENQVSPLTGAIVALHRRAGPGHLHAYSAPGPAARVHGDERGWEGFRDGMMAGGKGTSDEAARASALAEALERFSGEFSGSEPRRRATIASLGEDAVAPNDYMRFSERQFAERAERNARSESFRTRVPEPFDPRLEIDWSPVWSMTRQRQRFLPTALCYYGAHVAGGPYCIAESNGNAAGNTLEEAILHGILELVERDHVALWWFNRLPAPGVDLDTIEEPWLARLREQLASEGRRFWALDLTADLGIPAAAALVANADGSGVGMGLGAHLDLHGAVVRAATELAQLGLGAPSGGLGHGHDALHLDEQGFALPDPDAAPRSCRAQPRFDGTVIDALERCQTAVEQAGMELLVLDQTRPDIGLPVVKAVVPGLRHFWPRFGPGRLYDVPVALGRVAAPRTEDELNPVPPTP